MKKYVIAYMNYFDNVLKIYFTKAKTIKETVLNTVEKNQIKLMNDILSEDKKKIIQYYFNGDANIAIEEIPETFIK